MTTSRDDIIKLAHECGATIMQPYDYGAKADRVIVKFDALEAFFHAAQKLEREACDAAIKAIDDCDSPAYPHCREVIRNRSAT